MGFKENLKAELTFSGMRVKELSELSGVKKQTIDSYLRENGYTPSVDAAFRIAQTLGVSVEYLVSGQESPKGKSFISANYDLRLFIQSLDQLNAGDQKIIINNALQLINALKKKNEKVPS